MRQLKPQPEQIVLHGNALELDPELLTIDLLLCDPPYSQRVHSGMTSCAQHGARKGVRQRDAGFDHLSEELRAYIGQCAARSQRWSLVYSDLEGIAAWAAELDSAIPCPEQKRNGYVRAVPAPELGDCDGGSVGEIPWIRWSSPQQSGDRPPSGAECIVTGHAAGRMRWGGPGNLIELRHKALRGDGKHTTEKPLDQALDLVAWFSEPGEWVYDPTAGRATTGLACALLGRNFLGIEQQATEVELGQARIDATRRGSWVYDRDHERYARWLESMHDRLAYQVEQKSVKGDAKSIHAALESVAIKCMYRKGLPMWPLGNVLLGRPTCK